MYVFRSTGPQTPITREHAKPGEELLRAGYSAIPSHNDRKNLRLGRLISFFRDMGKECPSSDAGNFTNFSGGLV